MGSRLLAALAPLSLLLGASACASDEVPASPEAEVRRGEVAPGSRAMPRRELADGDEGQAAETSGERETTIPERRGPPPSDSDDAAAERQAKQSFSQNITEVKANR